MRRREPMHVQYRRFIKRRLKRPGGRFRLWIATRLVERAWRMHDAKRFGP